MTELKCVVQGDRATISRDFFSDPHSNWITALQTAQQHRASIFSVAGNRVEIDGAFIYVVIDRSRLGEAEKELKHDGYTLRVAEY